MLRVGGMSLLLVGCALCMSSSAQCARAADVQRANDADALVIEHVNVLPMTGGPSLADVAVVVSKQRIVAIQRSGKLPGDSRLQRIDGRGKWLMPGLADLHVHQESARLLRLLTGDRSVTPVMFDEADLLLPYVANGVLQLFNPAATTEQIGLRDEIDAGHLLAPHIELAAMVDGSPPVWPEGFAHVVATAEGGRQFVHDMKADGFSFLKTYSQLDLASFTAILDEARKSGLRVVGHIPGRSANTPEKWLQPGFEMVMHAEEYALQARTVAEAEANIPRYAALTARNKTALTATLTTDERILEQMRNPDTLRTREEIAYVNPTTRRRFWFAASPYAHASPERIAMFAQIVSFNQKLVKAFADAGIPVFPGTDSLVPGVVSGFALHDELEALQRADLGPTQILTAATRQAAEWLGVSADRGTVEVGKRADLLLLDDDPRLDVANTRRIAAVFVSGHYLPRSELDRRMAALKNRYASELVAP
jgi:imidazolonepropionase-like amidohydrolase